MEMKMITVIRTFSFILSTIGWWEVIKRNSDVDINYIPSLTNAIQIVFLFFCGLLNLLSEGVTALFLFGLVFLVQCLFKRKKAAFDFRPNYYIGFLFLFGVFTVEAAFLNGRLFTHYDNFSHWGLVVKRMLEVNRFPNFQDPLIEFQEYPLGSATFIYYFCKITSPSEAAQMLAQTYLMLCCIQPIFSFARKNCVACFSTILIATNFFFTYNIALTDLLVDTLLPLAGMCGVLFAVTYCGKEASSKNILLASCYAAFLVQIKNSGLFFACIICAWNLYYIRNGHKEARMVAVLFPILSSILWHKHCAYVFYAAKLSKHALSLSNYKDVFFRKSAEDIYYIIKAMVKFSLLWKDVWLTIFLFLLLGVVVSRFAKAELKEYGIILLASALLYTLYQIGQTLMFLFSMPGSEAIELLGRTRYSKTIILSIIYIFLVLAIKTISGFPNGKRVLTTVVSVVISASICGLLFFSTGEVRTALTYTGWYSGDERAWLETVKNDYQIPCGSSYCILIPKADSGYTFYLGKYIFQSPYVSTKIINNETDFDDINGKFIIIYDEENESIKNWVRLNYPDFNGSKVIVRDEIIE